MEAWLVQQCLRSLARKKWPCPHQGDSPGLPDENHRTSLCPRAASASPLQRALPPPHCTPWPPSPDPEALGRSRAIFLLHRLERVRLAGVVRAPGQVSLGPPVVITGLGCGGSQCLTSALHPQPKNKAFTDLNPDPCFSNTHSPFPTISTASSGFLASSRLSPPCTRV